MKYLLNIIVLTFIIPNSTLMAEENTATISLINQSKKGEFKIIPGRFEADFNGKFFFHSTNIYIPFCGKTEQINYKIDYGLHYDLDYKRFPLSKSYDYTLTRNEHNNIFTIKYSKFDMSPGVCGYRMEEDFFDSVGYDWVIEGKIVSGISLGFHFTERPITYSGDPKTLENQNCQLVADSEIDCFIDLKDIYSHMGHSDKTIASSYYSRRYYFDSKSSNKNSLENLIHDGIKVNIIITNEKKN